VSLEAAGKPMVRITVEKDMALKFPRVRAENDTLCVGIANTFDPARQLAIDQAYEFLTEEVGLAPFDAYVYASKRRQCRLRADFCF
jgi:acetamidase/formamidase